LFESWNSHNNKHSVTGVMIDDIHGLSEKTQVHCQCIVKLFHYSKQILLFIFIKVDHPDPQDVMMLTCEGWCHLQCKRVIASDPDPPIDSSFSLLPALEDGYFSDLSITASNNKQVQDLNGCVI
jgi:hypothetical protein